MHADCPDPSLFDADRPEALSPEQTEAVAAHLETCASCAEAADRAYTPGALESALRGSAPEASAVAPSVATVNVPSPVVGFEVGDQVGRFRLTALLGKGGMGAVFRGEDETLRRAVAVKVMLPAAAARPEMKSRFLREARAAAGLVHDNVVPVYHVDERLGMPYLVMPLLVGCTLEQRLRDLASAGGALTPGRVVEIASGMASGLAAAHAAGVIHRDVKPANVWLDASANDRPRLLDFGLALPAFDDGEDLTTAGMVLGTPVYMAPEQARTSAVDARADLFSLGVVLYRLCTGKLPFAAADPAGVLLATALHEPPPPERINAAVPHALSSLVMRLLEKESYCHPPSASAVVEELACMSAAEAVAPPVAPAPTPRREVPRWIAAVATLAGVAALAAAVVTYVETPNGTIRLEVDDPEIEVRLGKGGPWIREPGKEPITLSPGERVLTVRRGDFSFETAAFALRRGDKTVVRVSLHPGKVKVERDGLTIAEADRPAPAAFPPLRPGWGARVAKLPVAERLVALEAELRERNPAAPTIFAEPPVTNEERVTKLTLGRIEDLSPLAGVPELSVLVVPDAAALADLRPLAGVRLTELDLGTANGSTAAKIRDLSPLARLPLEYFRLRTSEPAGLGPLASLPLRKIQLWGLPDGADYSPLVKIRGLSELHLFRCRLGSLAPLSGLSIDTLEVTQGTLEDIDAARTMTLRHLNISRNRVKSLAALRGLKLPSLQASDMTYSKDDLAVLAGLPLVTLNAMNCGITDLSFLKGKKLTNLLLTQNPVRDLSPLAGMDGLVQLWVDDTDVADLSKLNGLPIEELSLGGTQVPSLKGVEKLPLKHLYCDYDPARDRSLLRGIKTLETINEKDAKEVLGDD